MNTRTPQALAAELRQKAQNLRPGADKDHLLREARHLETMASAKEWASSIAATAGFVITIRRTLIYRAGVRSAQSAERPH